MEKDFIKGKVEKKVFDNGGEIIKVSIPADELKRIEKNGWINVDIKTGKESGKLYMENNTFEPKKQEPQESKEEDIKVGNIPF